MTRRDAQRASRNPARTLVGQAVTPRQGATWAKRARTVGATTAARGKGLDSACGGRGIAASAGGTQLSAYVASANAQTNGVAYVAHIGGFIFGAVTGRFFEGFQGVAEWKTSPNRGVNPFAVHRIQSKRDNMLSPIVGLHHVTAIASDPQKNLDFYTQVLGLRFVKRTVNFDDPGTYHLYFGDDAGSPGTILTFFPWSGAARGHAGAGEVTKTAFNVPAASLEYWQERLSDQGLLVEHTGKRFEEQVLTFPDPDGMKIEIVAHADAGPVNAPRFASVPPEHAIRGFFGVTLLEHRADLTAGILKVMGFRKIAEEGTRLRFSAASQALGNHIDLLVDPNAKFGRQGAGSVHHSAFRAKDDAAQKQWREEIARHLEVTPVLDRTYFHSIYFREPGGVLFELATDPPGFCFDEPAESLGEELRLPQWLEKRRTWIEQRLLPITPHKSVPPIELQTEAGATV